MAATTLWSSNPVCAQAEGRNAEEHEIRLVLQITIDQLRADVALRDRDHWGKGGFRRLYDEGAVFSDAHHAHANTETVVGHATLATGADPAVHGMVGNVWFDRDLHALRYNVEDPRYRVAGDDGGSGDEAAHPQAGTGQAPTGEIPTSQIPTGQGDGKKDAASTKQSSTRSQGRSPEAMLAPTIADSIALAGEGLAKVFSVSLKDRAAVPMAGRAGKALWWSDASGKFISSTYYFPDGNLPAWANAWNDLRRADLVDGQSWSLLLDRKLYQSREKDDAPWEVPPPGMTRVFPHRFDRRALGDGYYSAVAASPFGDELLVDFARDLLRTEKLGRDGVVDYLAVGFSAGDFIGHRYGPFSLEMEDEVLRLDREVAALLRAVDEVVGEGHTLIVLSSDHGVAEPAEELIADGRSGGHIVVSEVERHPKARELIARCGGKLIERLWPPYVYLNLDALEKNHVDPRRAADELAALLAEAEGVEAVFTRAQIEVGPLPDIEAARAVRRSFFPARSGDLHVVSKQGWQISFESPASSQYATGHGTPWPYDTHVPLVFAGANVRKRQVGRRVETVDVAPTIAAILGIAPPLRASGVVLAETLR